MPGRASAIIFLGELANNFRYGMSPNERPFLRVKTHGEHSEAELLYN